ncbi:unnamed protein product [Polarella glacialis]|uniref:Uncharacterized protein n=1 Tax=Polarella glacialis TaxID=89957 RepID=A0A813LVJ8_POLGL|nr:unnamed protein product [Polarella glacialis]
MNTEPAVVSLPMEAGPPSQQQQQVHARVKEADDEDQQQQSHAMMKDKNTSNYSSQQQSKGAKEELVDMEHLPPKVSRWKLAAYCHLGLVFSTFHLTVSPARGAVYIEALKMSPGSQALLISICKSLDFLLGFVVAQASDMTRTRWGRRKPFIALAFPIAIISFIMLCNPALVFQSRGRELKPCTHLTVISGEDSCQNMGNETLAACLTAAFRSGDLDEWNQTISDTGQDHIDSAGLMVYFAVFYFGYTLFGATGTMIPYNALGMELTTEQRDRSLLYGMKAACQFIGYAVPIMLQVGLNSFLASDVPLQYSIMSLVFSAWAAIGLAILLMVIKERPISVPAVIKPAVPLVPSIRRLLANKPYRWFLLLNIPQALCALLPSNLVAFYVKAVLQQENGVAMTTIVSGTFLFAALLSITPLVWFANRYGRSRVLCCMMFQYGIACSCVCFLPAEFILSFPAFFYFLIFCIGVGTMASFVLTTPMLNDIVDYDELLSGERNEGMFNVVEANLGQIVEIVGGVLPLLAMQAAGYQANGGCACGCGVDCMKEVGMPYARWHCPNDIGYSCMGTLTSKLIFGDSTRAAPCTSQNDAVQLVIRVFFGGVPAICAFLMIIPAMKINITTTLHKAIMKEIQLRAEDPDRICIDPFTGLQVILPTNSPPDLFKEHYSTWERRMATRAQDVLGKLKQIVGGQLFISFLVGVAILVGCSVSNDVTVATLGSLAMAVVFLIVPWNIVRLRLLVRSKPSDIPKPLAEDDAPASVAWAQEGLGIGPPAFEQPTQ